MSEAVSKNHVATYVDAFRELHGVDPPRQTRTRIGVEVSKLLKEGVDHAFISRGVQLLAEKGMDASMLPSYVTTAMAEKRESKEQGDRDLIRVFMEANGGKWPTGSRFVRGITSGTFKQDVLGFDKCPYCHDPSSRVLTTDLIWKPAGDVVVGDRLWALDESSSIDSRRRRYRRAVVADSWLDKKRCCRINLDTGETFICSWDHPWLSSITDQPGKKSLLRWTEAINLKTAPVLFRAFIPWEHETTYEAGWLAGMFDGEGSVHNGKGRTGAVAICQAVGRTADRLIDVAGRYGSFQATRYPQPAGKTMVKMVSNGGGMADTARFLGTIRPERLIQNFEIEGGYVIRVSDEYVASVEDVGMREVQSISTTASTYFTEGFAVHNSTPWGRPSRGDVVAALKALVASGVDITVPGVAAPSAAPEPPQKGSRGGGVGW